MDELSLFAESAAAFGATVDHCADLPVPDRLPALRAALADLYAAGTRLPVGASMPVGDPSPAVPLGRYDAALRTTSDGSEPASVGEALGRIDAWARAGLGQPDLDAAQRVWIGGWRAAAADSLFALGALHEATERLRESDPKPTTGPPVPTLLARSDRGWLGLRFEPLGIGVIVREVAPRGPCDGHLRPGDVILSAEGAPLDALDRDELARLLVPKSGASRTVEVYRDGATFEVALTARDAP